MKLFRMIAAGALSYVAYRAWQRRDAAPASTTGTLTDAGSRTAPHGDPVLAGQSIDVGPEPGAGSQSSRNFGEP